MVSRFTAFSSTIALAAAAGLSIVPAETASADGITVDFAFPVTYAPPPGKGPGSGGGDTDDGGSKGGGKGGGGGGGGGGGLTVYEWMHPDVSLAFDANELGGSWTGAGATIHVVDNFSGIGARGSVTGGRFKFGAHGDFVHDMAFAVAPGATMLKDDNSVDDAISAPTGFTVFNLSYGMISEVDSTSYETNWIANGSHWEEQSLIDYGDGDALVVKAAGNTDGTGILVEGMTGPTFDLLNADLAAIDPTVSSVLFVGEVTPGTGGLVMTATSTIAGTDQNVQDRFLVVDTGDQYTGLAGTSFAAPIVSGYAAIIYDKFSDQSPTPKEVSDRLLATALETTIAGYNEAVHGQGEASLYNALAPDNIR